MQIQRIAIEPTELLGIDVTHCPPDTAIVVREVVQIFKMLG